MKAAVDTYHPDVRIVGVHTLTICPVWAARAEGRCSRWNVRVEGPQRLDRWQYGIKDADLANMLVTFAGWANPDAQRYVTALSAASAAYHYAVEAAE